MACKAALLPSGARDRRPAWYATLVTLTTFALLVLLGFAVGVFGTLVGAGGGFILTPVLLLLYPQDSPSLITAISLTVVFFNAASGSLAYARLRRIDYRSGVAFAVATMPGAVLGVLLVQQTPRGLFAAITAGLLSALAGWLLLGHGSPHDERGAHGSPRVLVDRAGTEYRYSVRVARGVAFSVGVGLISSFLGIGGGVLHVPLLVRGLGFPVHIATATSHFVLANMAGVGTITHVLSGSFAASAGVHRSLALSLGVIGGSQVGAIASQRIHGRVIQHLLAVALILVAIRLLISVF